jgi:hypothetical protein
MGQRDRASFDEMMNGALEMLYAWAEAHPCETDPKNVIEDIVVTIAEDSDFSVDPERIRAGLWEEWAVIEGDRELMNEFEDDLD